jgi:acyl dehydratase
MTTSRRGTIRPTSVEDLRELVGVELGPTGWRTITQEDVDAFAELTGDRQWIHVDTTRAATSLWGTTVAHGLYSLSLGPSLVDELIDWSAFRHGLNYGYGRVRFPAPVPVGSRLRMRATFEAVDDRGESGIHLVATLSFEREGYDKPTCVAESLSRLFV